VNLDGSAVLHADPDRVWSTITDPAVLARTIPGCLQLEQVGEDDYKMQVSVGVGAVRGVYAGEVRLSDQQRPSSYVMHASGAGAPGQVRAKVEINLHSHEPGTTTLTYSADAVVGGPVAGVGQRMAGQFFSAIDAELTGTAPAVPAAVRGAPAAAAAPGDGIFVGRAPAPPTLDLHSLVLGAAVGGAFTALGVLIGYLLGRRR
jgi:carbon monoxide dehydrogenase subunit G